jgi:CRISPR-associated protein Csx3
MNLLPALVIGGPPHAGKSVLAFSLSQALRSREVAHYVLRAYPDGEGDWSNLARQELVRAIRIKGQGTPEWTRRICRDIAHRHLPLIVDPGGRPTDWQEAVFDQCTHAILLSPDDESHPAWTVIFGRHSLPIIADLRSELQGANALQDAGSMLRGTLAGLERGQMAGGPAFEALVERVSGLFSYSLSELRDMHLSQAPVELVIELSRLGRTLKALDSASEWLAQHLPRVLDYLPPATPLGLYDRGPNWLYAALALYAHPEPVYQFDVRLGWIRPPVLGLGQPAQDAPLQARLHQRPDHTRIELTLQDAYLDYGEAEGLCVPPAPAGGGIVLSGKLPLWLWTAISLAYESAPWLGIYQPRLHDQAVIVKSHTELTVGQTVCSAPATVTI